MSTIQTVSGVMGNVLEWFDFSLFAFFSTEIAHNFFPEDDEDSLLKSFAIFGAAFLVRPVGGLLIGHAGDKHGRKKALSRAILFMAIPTTLMGCLPTYKQVGGFATFLLVMCRVFQGISVGGQLPASLVYTVEQRPREHWGYYGSFPMVAANCGSLLGNLAAALMRQIFTEDQLQTFGWRLPFFSGILIALVAVFLRRTGDEVHPNENVYDTNESPIVSAFASKNWRALLSSSLAPMLWAGGFYISFVWMTVFMTELIDEPMNHAFWINAAALLVSMTFMLPIAGAFSDRAGRTQTMSVAAIALVIGGPLAIVIIATGSPGWAFLCQVGLGIALSFFGAPLCAWLVEHYEPNVRLTSASWGYDLAHALAGGSSPFFATMLQDKAGNNAPGVLYTILGILSLLGLCLMRGRKGLKEMDTNDANNTSNSDNIATTTTEETPANETELPSIT